MDFEIAHAAWIRSHLDRRAGERKGRLERGHRHGKLSFLLHVWWPLVGHFDHLHPEYEVLDWRGRSYFADFAWLPHHTKIIFEIKGFGPHVRDMDRKRYCDELNRETFLQTMGFRVISFSYDDVADRPELCMTLLRMLLSRYQTLQASDVLADRAGKEIVLLAFELARPIRPKDVENHLGVDHRTAVRHLDELCKKGWLKPLPSGKGLRIFNYGLARTNWQEWEW
ncbi:hypothetical protein PAE9249_02124 [Paenibacillus sp. CECT 9249]|uniref:endonuclease domain-containing protein n=1 Tax=Paenibacillus sp. CECT 9249 TaxID=2845385 RepID=UPI001E3F8E6F|nr:endonuclease domain-containing protein [Paenibacillus sp. CECT 9249]CAH0119619.1 hypothetical protein PAE9249_02124 [Paenibacillus sp. CECT 9249]